VLALSGWVGAWITSADAAIKARMSEATSR